MATGGELFDSIVKVRHYSERDAAQLIRTIVSVVAHCHNMGVIHRDLKPGACVCVVCACVCLHSNMCISCVCVFLWLCVAVWLWLFSSLH